MELALEKLHDNIDYHFFVQNQIVNFSNVVIATLDFSLLLLLK